MHILIVTDQHPASLGGAQVAIRAQRVSLERLGHRVSIVAPTLHRPGYRESGEDRDVYIELPSRPITRDKEYGFSWPTRRTDRALATALRARPPVDIVHVQGDFWGAMIGVRVARGLRVPLVFTLHNNVDQGTRALTPLAPIVFLALRVWRGLSLGRVQGRVQGRVHGRVHGRVAPIARGAWRYLAELAAEADAVLAPSAHFAAQLVQRGVAESVETVRGGADDGLIEAARRTERSDRARPLLVWLGRMSSEKRVLEFVEAVHESGIDADVHLYGAGLLMKQVGERIVLYGLEDRVKVVGTVSHEAALTALRDADALVQTSIGFETQGLTPFEAALLGTPTIFCDQVIAEDVAMTPSWLVAGDSVAELALTLGEAVQQLHEAPGAMRVGESNADHFLQSNQTRKLLKIYDSLV